MRNISLILKNDIWYQKFSWNSCELEEFFFLKLGEYDSILSAKMIANLSSRSVIFSALALSAHQ